jgi:transglutaminase-like putative cysteine protease
MALLSRELGVPSRVVYGATTGKEKEPGEYVVTGYNMHTWVEVYFPASAGTPSTRPPASPSRP